MPSRTKFNFYVINQQSCHQKRIQVKLMFGIDEPRNFITLGPYRLTYLRQVTRWCFIVFIILRNNRELHFGRTLVSSCKLSCSHLSQRPYLYKHLV